MRRLSLGLALLYSAALIALFIAGVLIAAAQAQTTAARDTQARFVTLEMRDNLVVRPGRQQPERVTFGTVIWGAGLELQVGLTNGKAAGLLSSARRDCVVPEERAAEILDLIARLEDSLRQTEQWYGSASSCWRTR